MSKFVEKHNMPNVVYTIPVIILYFLGCINFIFGWDPMIDTIWTIKEIGGRVDWSHSGNDLIAFDRREADDYYDIFTMNPDGSNEMPLTIDHAQLPNRNMGNPAWCPSGAYIVFQAEKTQHPWVPTSLTEPGAGIYNDLWLITNAGDSVWQLTDLDTTTRTGVLHPHFSHDGTKLLWSERLNVLETCMKIADFVIDENGPHLENDTIYQPGDQHIFYETHGFFPGDTVIIFSGNLIAGQHWTGLDIYLFNINTHQLIPLTYSYEVWDEHAIPRPDGNKVVWMSSTGYWFDPITLDSVRCDYWLMDPDSSNKVRLTYFNEPGHPEYTGEEIVAADNSWSPDGMRLVAYLIFGTGTGRIAMIEFEDSGSETERHLSAENIFFLQNHPNPFNRITEIRWQIADGRLPITDNNLQLRIYDVGGRLVRQFLLPTSYYLVPTVVKWDGTDDCGKKVAQGVYFCRLELGNVCVSASKLLLLR